MNNWVGIILAAGKSSRMKSGTSKVLHKVGGKPMLIHIIEALKQASITNIIIVTSKENESIINTVGSAASYSIQPSPKGTGDAIKYCSSYIKGKFDQILVMNGDTPLIDSKTLKNLMDLHSQKQSDITFLTGEIGDLKGLGRIIRNTSGKLIKIVEEHEATAKELESNEFNSGIYCINNTTLWEDIDSIKSSNKGEYYITELAEINSRKGRNIQSITLDNNEEIIGVNDRNDLSIVEEKMRYKILRDLMFNGVTIRDPKSTFIEGTVSIEQDTIIEPNTYIYGKTSIGKDCKIGPNTSIFNSNIDSRCSIISSHVEESIIESDVDIGPFSHIRKDTVIRSQTHIGNFVEIKKSEIGLNSKIGHFSYLGDANIGNDVNIGAGTVTCNFDGINKNLTIIGDKAFIGCDTMLVAPITVGNDAATGAGAVVTNNVPANTLVAGVPAKIIKTLHNTSTNLQE